MGMSDSQGIVSDTIIRITVKQEYINRKHLTRWRVGLNDSNIEESR